MSDHRDFYRGRKVLVTGGPRLHRLEPLPHARRPRRRRDRGRQPAARLRRQPVQPRRLRGEGPHQHRRRARPRHGVPGPGPGGAVQPGRAGEPHRLDDRIPSPTSRSTARSQLRLLEAVRHGNPELKVVYAGTRQVYGRPLYLPVDEKHLLQPVDVNGINKISGEFYHLVYHQVYGIRASSLRLTNTYGPRQLIRHNRQGFIGWFVRQAALRRGDPDLRRRQPDARLQPRRRRGRRLPARRRQRRSGRPGVQPRRQRTRSRCSSS